MPITTKAVRSNHAHGEVYSIQHYAMKFVSDLYGRHHDLINLYGICVPQMTTDMFLVITIRSFHHS